MHAGFRRSQRKRSREEKGVEDTLNIDIEIALYAIKKYYISPFPFKYSCSTLGGRRRKPVSAVHGVRFCVSPLHDTVIAVELVFPSRYHLTYSWSCKL